jgi:hypothetical protein
MLQNVTFLYFYSADNQFFSNPETLVIYSNINFLNQDLQDFEDFQVADFILYDALCSPKISADYQ